jgi:rSAM/selenodomain-associated transferase 1
VNDLLVIQFAKWPVLGNVKTRLAHAIGDQKALQVHMTLMDEVLNKLTAAKYDGIADIELWLNEIPAAQGLMRNTLKLAKNERIFCKIQKGNDLGDKMADAMISSLETYKKVIIVGSDCPNISTKTLKEASECLNKTDIVLGPAEDGGYVLIGASNFNAEIFNDVAWGKGKVFEKTIENIKKLNFTYSILSESWDVDDLADYERWCNSKQS